LREGETDALAKLPDLDAREAEAVRATGTDDARATGTDNAQAVLAAGLADLASVAQRRVAQASTRAEKPQGQKEQREGPETPVSAHSGPFACGEPDGSRTRNPQIDSLEVGSRNSHKKQEVLTSRVNSVASSVALSGQNPRSEGIVEGCVEQHVEGLVGCSCGGQYGKRVDPELAAVVDAWPSLPAALKAAVLAIVKVSSEGKADVASHAH